ncbi:hypothetical protein SAMN02799622_00603 [Methylobacterium sp. UNC378MF]|uniref:hypothetical protein n=1 Tax=Methylobacterium sp. UNC378MF TaxID=1502748 RepID=UPI00088FA140|nr:hypothetical protein [Methylobacterium sp. UNC378MF]SDA11453.1 hypothetical protein SAMN02799622_00603 [Methylobacterium sp. UNC378MF]
MRTRLSRATRLLKLQERLHQRAEQEHALLERRVQMADTAREDLIRALNEASAFHEPLRATAVHRLKTLAVAAQELRAERDASTQQLRARATQHRRTELWVDRLGAEVRHWAEKRDWAERLDRLTGATEEASLRSARPANPASEPRLPTAAAGPAGPVPPDTSAQ